MLANYLKVAWRNIIRHKGYSFLNIFGLAAGMACAMFIVFWIQDELSFNRFHANASTLFRVEQSQATGQGKFHVNVTPYPLGPALKAEIPEIKETTRMARPGDVLVRYGENAFFESRVLAVDPQIFQMFTFPLIKGDPASALNRPGSLVISESMAKKYFADAEPMGKNVTINNTHAFTISGVMKNVPANSTFSFDMLVPFDFVKTLGQYNDSMGQNNIVTYVQIHPQSNTASVEGKISKLVEDRIVVQIANDPELQKRMQNDPALRKRLENYRGPDFSLMPLVDLRLFAYFGFNRNDMEIQYVITFGIIALVVLLIACINFMNLATARSLKRAKEVGLRKVVGAQRKSIIVQFYGESIVTAFLAGAVAILLVHLLLPVFNTLSGKLLTMTAIWQGKSLLGILAVTLFTGIVAGSYPALFLSSFRPAKVLKGGQSGSAKGARLRKGLVVLQFGLSILLLIGMGVVARQIDYMRNKQLGYDKEQLIYLPLRGETYSTYAALKEQLLRNPRLLNVTATHQEPTSISSNGGGADWDGKDPSQNYLIGYAAVDFDYAETLKIEMAAGRTFSKKFTTDGGKAWMVNEAVTRLMGLDPAAAVGKRFSWGVEGTIIGVMKNFHYQSVRSAIEPLAVIVAPEEFRFVIVRLKAGEIPASLQDVRKTWQRVFPQYPFEYRFFDEDFGRMYRADESMGSLLKAFAGLAVIIACLGLFGLASYTAEQRTKEIGVRKFLGASSPGIVLLFLKQFAKWVLLANLLAWPCAYILTKNWLQGFAYRSTVAWWLFALAGAGTLIIALLTVSFQAVRAARANPVDSLRYE